MPSPSSNDYINASHIRLRGTSKHYIASQGPLECTTEHFWQLVIQENVSTIVMLTLLSEGGREKCYNYFQTKDYGSVSVVLKEEIGNSEAMKKSISENTGFFGMETSLPPSNDLAMINDQDVSNDNKSTEFSISKGYQPQHEQVHHKSTSLDAATIRRTIEVYDKRDATHKPPLVVTHLQYIRWPDFDIPPDSNCVIDLIDETARAQKGAVVENAPVLVHCSAGVGRTGSESFPL